MTDGVNLDGQYLSNWVLYKYLSTKIVLQYVLSVLKTLASLGTNVGRPQICET